MGNFTLQSGDVLDSNQSPFMISELFALILHCEFHRAKSLFDGVKPFVNSVEASVHLCTTGHVLGNGVKFVLQDVTQNLFLFVISEIMHYVT